jgi:site-specific recombinase XerD
VLAAGNLRGDINAADYPDRNDLEEVESPAQARAGVEAGFKFGVHPHMLRHACGYALANAGHDTRSLQAYLGHKNIQHTVRYTELSPARFKNFWR